MRPWDVYAKELSTLSRGHAVHNPRRDKFQSGLGLRPAIDVGDIAYDLDGKLIRLFNCLKPQDQQDEDCVFPDDFEVLELAQTRDGTRSAPIVVKENHSRPGPLFSKGVLMLKVEAGASVTSIAGARIMFSTRHEQGAVLVTSGLVRTRQSPNRPAFERYMVKHYDSWCSLLRSQELDVLPEGLMLITGVETTQAWSNITFSERQLEGEFSIDVPTASPAGVSLAVSFEVSRTQSVSRDSGPNPEDMEIEDGMRPTGHEPNRSDERQVNQVVFVRALRGKKRIFRGLKIVANADPQDLNDGSSSEEDGSGLSIESVGSMASREDFLLPLLDFILENSDAEMAVVHDDDYKAYDHYMTNASAFGPPDSLVRYHGGENMTTLFGVFNCQAIGMTASSAVSFTEFEDLVPSPRTHLTGLGSNPGLDPYNQHDHDQYSGKSHDIRAGILSAKPVSNVQGVLPSPRLASSSTDVTDSDMDPLCLGDRLQAEQAHSRTPLPAEVPSLGFSTQPRTTHTDPMYIAQFDAYGNYQIPPIDEPAYGSYTSQMDSSYTTQAHATQRASPDLPDTSDPRRLPPLSVPPTSNRYHDAPYYPHPQADPALISPADDVRSPPGSYPQLYAGYSSLQGAMYGQPMLSSSRAQAGYPGVSPHAQFAPATSHVGVERTSSRHVSGQYPYARIPPATTPTDNGPQSSEPSVKKKRKRADARQLEVLTAVFARTQFPSTEERIQLGEQLGMTPRTVQIWFQARRQALRQGQPSGTGSKMASAAAVVSTDDAPSAWDTGSVAASSASSSNRAANVAATLPQVRDHR